MSFAFSLRNWFSYARNGASDSRVTHFLDLVQPVIEGSYENLTDEDLNGIHLHLFNRLVAAEEELERRHGKAEPLWVDFSNVRWAATGGYDNDPPPAPDAPFSKIEMIKLFRRMMDLGIREGKEMVERGGWQRIQTLDNSLLRELPTTRLDATGIRWTRDFGTLASERNSRHIAQEEEKP